VGKKTTSWVGHPTRSPRVQRNKSELDEPEEPVVTGNPEEFSVSGDLDETKGRRRNWIPEDPRGP